MAEPAVQQTRRFVAWPVTVVNGQPSMPEAALRAIWQQMVEEDRAEAVFYDGGVYDEASWLRFITDSRNLPVFILDSLHDKPAMIAWVNDIGDGAAKVHFCGLGPYRRGCGDAVLDYFDLFRDDFGEPLFRVLIGVTPESHTGALKLSEHLGFTPIGTIPEMCHLVYEDRRVGGVISYRRWGHGRR